MVGLIVDQIVDIHSESIRIVKKGSQEGLSGSAVIGGKVTDFLDLPSVLSRAGEGWLSEKPKRGAPVLVADSRSFSRGLVRNYLELAGYSVIEAADQMDAIEKLTQNRVVAAIVSDSLSSKKAGAFTSQLKEDPSLAQIPLVVICDSSQDLPNPPGGISHACVERFDRHGLIASLERLTLAREAADGQEAQVEFAGSAR
jgi:CheY-like chemotaxis protein